MTQGLTWGSCQWEIKYFYCIHLLVPNCFQMFDETWWPCIELDVFEVIWKKNAKKKNPKHFCLDKFQEFRKMLWKCKNAIKSPVVCRYRSTKLRVKRMLTTKALREHIFCFNNLHHLKQNFQYLLNQIHYSCQNDSLVLVCWGQITVSHCELGKLLLTRCQ